MRIISGNLKGRKLRPPQNLSLRPTTGFAKEGLFNHLNHQIDFRDLDVLDLCCGTGSISFEFASRGVKSVLCVDLNTNCLKYIKKQAAEFELTNIFPYKSDLFQFLKKFNRQFDLVFADPPYEMEGVKTIPELVLSRKLLKENGLLILEHGKDINFKAEKNLLNSRKYGNVNFTFFKAQWVKC